MTIYNFNLALGWASSGVEYAQAYRENIFEDLKMDSKFVFSELILNGNIYDMAKQIGMSIKNVLPMHFYFTDLKPSECVYTVESFEKSLVIENLKKSIDSNTVSYVENDLIIRVGLDRIHGNVDYVEFIKNGFLVQRDHYTYTKTFSEYFAPFDNQAELYRRVFFNENGSLSYEQVVDDGKIFYLINNHILSSEFEFVSYFFSQLNADEKDVLIIDREQFIAPTIFKSRTKAKIGVVIHAEHYSKNQTDNDHIVWNNFYEYQFTNQKCVDFFIVATNKQKSVLSEHFLHYKKVVPSIYAIPVGSLDKLRGQSKGRPQFKIITASRLAGEKHVDWIIHAVVKLHELIPDVSLDIYGSGGELESLTQLVAANKADEWINFKGHHDLTNIYKEYSAYVSASQSEGFGLTIMEAVGSGLPLVGFDVPYGNQEFIDNGDNGLLVPYTDDSSLNINALTEGLNKVLHMDKTKLMSESYKKAKPFLNQNVKLLWKNAIEEIQND